MAVGSLLESLDTTVTLEWEHTRTIGTLISLGGRQIVITALRAPPTGTTVYLRIEREESDQDAIAIDGVCDAVADSEWGEQQVDVTLHRVGTTTSAAALREFIETYGIERGGTVSVGRNRDNPEMKRYVYSLPEQPSPSAVVQAPSAKAATPGPAVVSAPAAIVSAPAAVAAPAFAPFAPSAPAVSQPAAAPIQMAPLPSFAPNRESSQNFGNRQAPVAVAAAAPKPAMGLVQSDPGEIGSFGTPVLDPAAFSADDLLSALQEAASAAGPTKRAASNVHSETTRRFVGAPGLSVPGMPDPDATRQLDVPTLDDHDHDDSEEIVVNTVEHGVQQAAPVNVKGADKPGFMARLLGGRKDEPEPDRPKRTTGPNPEVPAAQLFAGEFAHRMDLRVQFESGPKKRKTDGVLLRLGDSKLRIRSPNPPSYYERITVIIQGKGGPKDVLRVLCEVTRVHDGDGDANQATFDARLSAGGNPPAVMAKLRELMQGGPPLAETP